MTKIEHGILEAIPVIAMRLPLGKDESPLNDRFEERRRLAARPIPGAILRVVTEHFKESGRPDGTLRELMRRGFLSWNRTLDLYARTDKPLPTGALPGMPPSSLPPGAIRRLVTLWEKGRLLTIDDVRERAEHSPDDKRLNRPY